MNDNHGQVRIVEAFLAVLVIFSSFAVSVNFTVPQTSSLHDNLSDVGVRALQGLDHNGDLGRMIDNGNYTGLRETLNLLLPAVVSFNLTIYDVQMKQVNTEVISNGGFGSQQVAFAEYVCASSGPTFHVYIIHLWLARSD
jgi:hypothetical protein